MNDNFNENYENDNLQPVKGTLDTLEGFGNGYNNLRDFHSKNKEKDIKSINDRSGNNDDLKKPNEELGSNGKKDKKKLDKDKNSDDITNSDNENDSDDLDSKKSDKDDKDSSKENKDEDKENKDNDKDEDEDKDKKSKKDGFFEKRIKSSKLFQMTMRIKLIIIGLLVGVGIFAVAFVVVAIISLIDNLTLGLVSSFGLPEATESESGDSPGLYTDSKYKYDENGNPIGREELINYLENNSNCEGNFWTDISDAWNNLWGSKITDVCELIRYVKDEVNEYEVDEALIISTIFYGYDTRPPAEMYINKDDVPDEVKTTEHFQSLTELLQDNNTNITRGELSDLIRNAHASSNSYYYEWVIEETKNDSGSVTSITGKCVKKESVSEKYNLDKWKVYMRFGEEAAEKYDDVVLKTKNYESSSDECINEGNIYTKEKLEEQVSLAAGAYDSSVSYSLDYDSVTTARNDLKQVSIIDSEVFYQAADVDSKTKDTFKGIDGIEFDYKNGYAYKQFPKFAPSLEPGGVYYGKVTLEYDDVFTPKEVETLIQNIISRKTNMNDALMREDPDTPEDYYSSLNGYSGVPTGANCMPYLPASLSDIKVKLTDCYGNYLDTVTFEDYIIGVANGEVSNKNDDYVKSQMVAAISFALKRRNNYTKGTTIEMRSGTCDQVYCSMLRGCTSKKTPVGSCDICASYYIGGSKKYPELYPKYQALYEEASDYLLIKGNSPFLAHYINTYQNRWYAKASQGMAFTQIMQEEYEDEGAELIRCSDKDSEVENDNLNDDETEKVGNKPTTEYPNVSPNLGPYYGFSYKDGDDNNHITINPEWKNENLVTINPTCKGSPEFESKTFTVHKNAVANFEKAFKGVCKFLTNGVKIIDGSTCKYSIDNILDGTVFIERKTSGGTIDTHAYGIAQDLNYSYKITVNGKDYAPYNTRELSDYLEFVEAIGGREETCKNVNYILWAYAYKDAGFYWGGNYGRNGNSGTYDGKLFELKYK